MIHFVFREVALSYLSLTVDVASVKLPLLNSVAY